MRPFGVIYSSVEDLLNDEDDLEEDYNLDNDEEEKLLQDDSTDICENETSENELDESEDVLRLEPEDEFEEDEVEGMCCVHVLSWFAVVFLTDFRRFFF